MQFRHDRRRRVLADELADSELVKPAKEARLPAPERAEIYAPRAHRECQPRLVDFIPNRNLTLSLLLLAGLLLTAGIDAAHYYRWQLSTWMGEDIIAALDVGSRTSIASWCSALLLAVSGAMAMMLFGIRRWRVDDYYGRYRVWLLAALACFVISVNQTAQLTALLARPFAATAAACQLSGSALYGIIVLTLLCVATLRIWFELRRCRSSLVCWCLATICFAVSASTSAGWLPESDAEISRLVESSAHFVGLWMLLLMMSVYGRYVLLEVEGRIVQRAPKPRKVKKEKAVAEATSKSSDQPVKKSTPLRTDLEPVSKDKPVERPAAAEKRPEKREENPSSVDKPKLKWEAAQPQTQQQNMQELSRADRKKLKREMRRAA